MSKYEFALQWLDYLNVSIYNKGHQILKYDGDPQYDISPLNTRIRIGANLGDENDELETTYLSFLDFERMGFAIKIDTEIKWKHAQRVAYYIIRKTKNSIGITYDSFRGTHMKIEHDAPNRKFRLVGDNVIADEKLRVDAGIGPWVIYDDNPRENIHQKKKFLTRDDIRYALQGNKFGGSTKDAVEYQYINEIPIGMSDEKYIVCMPKHPNYCQRIVIVGQSGFGKSLSINGLAGRIFYAGDRVGWLIDPLNQFYDISLPQDHGEFNKINSWIGNEPKPIPAYQLYMACKYKYKIPHEKISSTLTLNFEEFLKKYKFYTYGIGDYDVGKTIRYLYDYLDDIKDIKSPDELVDVMFDKIPNAHKDKGMQAMIYKWKNTFETIFKEKFTTNVYENDSMVTDELEVQFKDGTKLNGHPFIMAMEAGLVPVLNVSLARRQRWLRNYLADLMQKIVAYQMQKPESKQNRMWIIADELNMIYEKGKRKDNASEAFEELYRQGRFNNIGFIGNTQSLDRLEPEMYKNANYIFCVYMQDNKDRKRMTDFQIDKDVYEQIGDLKSQEMMIFRSPGDTFVIYDKWGRRRVIEGRDRRWFKVRIFPPINHHKVPQAK